MLNKEQKEASIKEYLRSKVVSETSLYALLCEGVSSKNMNDIYSVTEECVKGDNEICYGKVVIDGNMMTIKIISNSWQKIHYVV